MIEAAEIFAAVHRFEAELKRAEEAHEGIAAWQTIRAIHAGCSVLESGQASVAVKAEDRAEPVKSEEAPAVEAEPGSSTPAAQPGSGSAKAQQPPTTPAWQPKSNSSLLASPSPFV